MPVKVPTRVVVHPIVLLSVVDHFNRLRKIGNQKRVVGVLLGSWRASGVVDVATSYAGITVELVRMNVFFYIQTPVVPVVPFDEDEREPSVWFLDHNYLENMSAMFRKVNGTQGVAF